jgi:hypothetical protein
MILENKIFTKLCVLLVHIIFASKMKELEKIFLTSFSK